MSKSNGSPGPGEMDVIVYKVDRERGLAFSRARNPNTGDWILGRDGHSACQVALRIGQIKDDGMKESLRPGSAFRAIISRTREGSTFDYFGEVVKAL
jgi:hypothetical protein